MVAKNDRRILLLSKQCGSLVERLYQALCHGVPDVNEPRLRGLRGVSFDGTIVKITASWLAIKGPSTTGSLVRGRRITRGQDRFGMPAAVARISVGLKLDVLIESCASSASDMD